MTYKTVGPDENLVYMDGEDMPQEGRIGGIMASAANAEQAHPLIPSEVNRIVGQIGWILQGGQEIDLRHNPEPNPPANARNAIKKFVYNYRNFQQTNVKIELYLVYMSMSAMDCNYFVYVNGANAATFRMQEFVATPPGGAPQLTNRQHLEQEVRAFLQPFGSLMPPPQQQVIMTQQQPTMVMAGPQPMIVTAPAQPQVIVAQAPPPMVVQQTGQQLVQCPRCGTQFHIQQAVTQTGYTQTTYQQQPMMQQPPPQNVTIQMSGMQPQHMGQGPICPACNQGTIDTRNNRCMNCGFQY